MRKLCHNILIYILYFMGMYLLYIIFSSNIVIEIIINGVIDEDAYNFSIIKVLGFIILLSEFGSIQFYSFERYLRFIE